MYNICQYGDVIVPWIRKSTVMKDLYGNILSDIVEFLNGDLKEHLDIVQTWKCQLSVCWFIGFVINVLTGCLSWSNHGYNCYFTICHNNHITKNLMYVQLPIICHQLLSNTCLSFFIIKFPLSGRSTEFEAKTNKLK